MRQRTIPILLAAAALVGCASAPPSPAASKVPVYAAPLDEPATSHRMPEGCDEISRQPAAPWTELAMTGVRDPYARQREETAAAGGNVLLVLSQMIVPRQCSSCPAASPITDCPPCTGAWYDVVFVSYACPARALGELPPERLP